MKTYKKLNTYLFVILLFCFTVSCNEDEFLEEVPLDFYSLENSYETVENFESALTDLYARIREIYYEGDDNNFVHFLATDIIKNARDDNSRFGNYTVWLVPTSDVVIYQWRNWYKIISNANTIISKIEETDFTDATKNKIMAEAKFFRAYAYRNLVYLYGGVPLVLDEIDSPVTNFQRASKEDVLNQMATDFSEAANNLPDIDNAKEGKVSNLVARHYLAETYISLGRYSEAISASTIVIDNPSTSLMTERFGTRATETPGDVYWDLFRRGNQNRSGGNKEALWVAQMEIDIPGGMLESSVGYKNRLERYAGPVAWLTFKDPDGNEGMLRKPRSNYNAGGRGVSFMSNTSYFLNDLWASDFNNDIRNAPHNIVRNIIYDNPESPWFDSSAVKYPSPTEIAQDWRWYPYPTKITTPGNHPDELYEDKDLQILKSSAGSTYTDQYILRLAETYLLRAEAYLANDDATNAANDINNVRSRSNASDVNAGDVTLDYILDERARELVYEEQRRITLQRVGKLVERVRNYNELNGDEIENYQELWPIPYAEIEANKDAVLGQNPGYN